MNHEGHEEHEEKQEVERLYYGYPRDKFTLIISGNGGQCPPYGWKWWVMPTLRVKGKTMERSVCFGVGITFMLIGFGIFYWIHSMDPGDNTPAGILIGSVLFCPGAILLGRAIWPPSRK